jgi:hypothetical protein
MGSYDGSIDTQIRRLENHLFPDANPIPVDPGAQPAPGEPL